MPEIPIIKPQYNNCFTLGGKSKSEKGNPIKVPMFIDSDGYVKRLWEGKDGQLSCLYSLPYENAKRTLDTYLNGQRRTKGDDSLRVSLYLDNAMYGNLHIFVIDIDAFDENSGFFQSAKNLADKVTRSQGRGYHMFYGVDKNVATPLFDSINLLTSDSAKSYVSSTGNVTLDGANKVDFFCDARHLIYEWEEWDNAEGLTDKTQALYELIRDNFVLKRPMGAGQGESRHEAGKKRAVPLDELDEADLLSRMNDAQNEIFNDLITNYSPDCKREKWFSVGINIWHVFGDDLGRDVFRFWSEPGHSFVPQGCEATWESIKKCAPRKCLNNHKWNGILHDNMKSAF
ncbi:MAG: PriCT-2 domain-containing protein [Butyricicoccus sp.]|nr:PriCT-2 domain-containing protein [Butyricicoccus sp.]